MNAVVQDAIDRSMGLGASDAAAAAGASRWKTPYQLYLQKTDPANEELKELTEQEQMRFAIGHAIEPVALSFFEKKSKLSISNRQKRYVDPAWPRRWVHVDADSSDGGYVEAKSTATLSEGWGHDEFEENAVPIDYYCQTQHGMACSGKSHVWVPVVVLNRQFRLYVVRRDEEAIGLLTAKERAFVELLDARTPPPPTNLQDAKLRWPKDDGSRITATPEVALASRRHHRIKALIKKLEQKRDELELCVKSHMGTHTELYSEDGKTLINTWKTARASAYFDEDTFAIQHPELYRQYIRNDKPGSRRLLSKYK